VESRIVDHAVADLVSVVDQSTTMPLKSERFAPDTFLPWAANLHPENEQLHTLGQILGMARGDVVGLLSAIGGDTAGALSIGHPGRIASVQWRPIGKPDDLERIIEELPNKPFLVGDKGVSMSLAGAQTKLAVAVDPAGPRLHPNEWFTINAYSQAGRAAPQGRGSKRNILFDAGEANGNSHARCHHRRGSHASAASTLSR
jgi:hypothetical protein